MLKQNGKNQIMKGGEIMDYNVKIEDEKNYGIYMIRNKVNNKKYIGQTRSGFRIRYTKHVSGFKTGRGHTKKFVEDYEKYGSDNFEFSILQIENDVTKLNDLEKEYITLYDSVNNGYNTQDGGNTVYNDKEVKDVFRSNRIVTEEFRKQRSEYMKNRIVTDETKERIRFANLGSKSPVSVLNEEMVVGIKTDLVNGMTIKDVSKKYEQNYSTVSAVAREISWGHIVVDGWKEYIDLKKKTHSRHILTYDEVRNIRKLLDEGYNESQVARMYGCCSSKINSIHRGLSFKNIH